MTGRSHAMVERDNQMAKLTAEGLTRKQIADRLRVSAATVSQWAAKTPAADCPAAYFASEVLALLERMRSRYQCASNDCAALLVSRSLEGASERAIDVYHVAIAALDDFLGMAESDATQEGA